MYSSSSSLGSSSTDSGFIQQNNLNTSNCKIITVILVFINQGDTLATPLILFGLLGYLFRSFNNVKRNKNRSNKKATN